MREKGFSCQEALEFVRKSRPVIRPNAGFIRKLERLEVVFRERNLYRSENNSGLDANSPPLSSQDSKGEKKEERQDEKDDKQ
jgi:hypothetical protein